MVYWMLLVEPLVANGLLVYQQTKPLFCRALVGFWVVNAHNRNGWFSGFTNRELAKVKQYKLSKSLNLKSSDWLTGTSFEVRVKPNHREEMLDAPTLSLQCHHSNGGDSSSTTNKRQATYRCPDQNGTCRRAQPCSFSSLFTRGTSSWSPSSRSVLIFLWSYVKRTISSRDNWPMITGESITLKVEYVKK